MVFAALHRSLCYSLPMNRFKQSHLLGLACMVLAACGAGTKKADILDIYELPRANQSMHGHPMPVDNDSYYTQPGGYQVCSGINDAPSCGGG